LKSAGVALAGAALVACQPTPEIVEKEVTQVVKETQIVKETQVVKETVQVEKVVEVTPVPPTGPVNTLGVTLPADALPLDQQFRLVSTGAIGSGLAAGRSRS
jgi:hypothetical protein